MKQFVRINFTALLLLFAAPAFAAETFADIVNNDIVKFVDVSLVPLMYAIAFLFFIFGVFKYFFTGGAENREQARDFMIWSLVGFFVLFSVWGLVKLALSLIPGA